MCSRKVRTRRPTSFCFSKTEKQTRLTVLQIGLTGSLLTVARSLHLLLCTHGAYSDHSLYVMLHYCSCQIMLLKHQSTCRPMLLLSSFNQANAFSIKFKASIWRIKIEDTQCSSIFFFGFRNYIYAALNQRWRSEAPLAQNRSGQTRSSVAM